MNKTTTTEIESGQFADVTRKACIRLHGIQTNHRSGGYIYDRTFCVGDEAEYGAHNTRFIGKIVRIGPKTVTIDTESCGRTGEDVRRLTLSAFSRRNYDFDLEAVRAYNAEESKYI